MKKKLVLFIAIPILLISNSFSQQFIDEESIFGNSDDQQNTTGNNNESEESFFSDEDPFATDENQDTNSFFENNDNQNTNFDFLGQEENADNTENNESVESEENLTDFFLESNTSSDHIFSDNVVDGLYKKVNIREKKLRNLAPVKEIDVIWSKRIWRILDLRNKINHRYYYPEIVKGNSKNIINILMDGVIEEAVFAYSPILDDFSIEMTSEEVKKIGTSIDTVSIIDPITRERSMRVVKNEFNRQDVKKLRLKEDWFVDRTRSKFDFRIIGICPIVEVFDEESGEFKGNKPLFWIYFPSLRRTINNYVSPSNTNDSDKKSYDELFLKRMFASYIYKQSNVQDKVIQDYARGVDALYESERIQEELIALEQSLWHY